MRIFKGESLIREGERSFIFKADAPLLEPAHTHDFIEIIYVLGGTADEIIDDTHYTVKKGDLLFINYGSIHSFTPMKDFAFINIGFSPKIIGEAVVTPENALSLLSLSTFDEMRGECAGGKFSFFGEERREIETIMNAMLAEEENKLPGYSIVMDNYISILITKMLRKNSIVSDENIGGLWQELLDYIDENISAKLTLSALAEKCFYNPSYFSRIFKEKFKMPPLEYVNRQRITKAVELLISTELSVDEISETVGFSDRSSFYHMFSKFEGVTPSKFREDNRR